MNHKPQSTRGGKRQGAGRKQLNRIQKTVHIENKNYCVIESVDGKTFSEKINNLINLYVQLQK